MAHCAASVRCMEEIVGEGRPTSYQFYTSTPDFQIDIADCLCKIK